jgi:hypothetical protein
MFPSIHGVCNDINASFLKFWKYDYNTSILYYKKDIKKIIICYYLSFIYVTYKLFLKNAVFALKRNAKNDDGV